MLAHVAAGAVLAKAGAGKGIALYVAYALFGVAATLLTILLVCDAGSTAGPCDTPLLYVASARSPEWLGIVLGVMLSPLVPSSEARRNALLRGAGAFAFGSLLVSTTLILLSSAQWLRSTPVLGLLFIAAQLVVGAVAGRVLARVRFAGVLLVALVVIGPSAGAAIALVRAGAAPGEPIAFAIARWSTLIAPLAGAVALIAGWAFAAEPAEQA